MELSADHHSGVCPFFFFFFLYREPFESDRSAQSAVQAGALRDHGSSAARRTRVETNQPAETTGEERRSVKVNSGSVPNHILLSSNLVALVLCCTNPAVLHSAEVMAVIQSPLRLLLLLLY